METFLNVLGQKATQGIQSSVVSQYILVRDALRRSGSSADEKDKYEYFDMINAFFGSRGLLFSHVVRCHKEAQLALRCSALDHCDTWETQERFLRVFAHIGLFLTFPSDRGDYGEFGKLCDGGLSGLNLGVHMMRYQQGRGRRLVLESIPNIRFQISVCQLTQVNHRGNIPRW